MVEINAWVVIIPLFIYLQGVAVSAAFVISRRPERELVTMAVAAIMFWPILLIALLAGLMVDWLRKVKR